MQLTWKGYGISITVLRRIRATTAEDKTDREAKQVHRLSSPQRRREIEREYILASASRYIAPNR